MRNLLPVAVHVMLLKSNKILLIRRFGTGFEDGNYGLVGGHLDGNETLKQAAARECLEEIGINVSTADLEFIGVEHYASPINEGLDFYFKTRLWQGKPYARAECDDVDWFKLNALPQNTIPFMSDAIKRHLLGGEWLSETGWDTNVKIKP